MTAAGVPVPLACPPGLSRRRWAAMTPGQRIYAVLTYWRALKPQTRELLDVKYGHRVETTRAVRRAAWKGHREP